MDSSELRKACEMAGLELHDQAARIKESQEGGSIRWWHYWLDDPALKPYIAELLVAKVRERGVDAEWLMYHRTRDQLESSRQVATATAEQKIIAAMAVLKGA